MGLARSAAAGSSTRRPIYGSLVMRRRATLLLASGLLLTACAAEVATTTSPPPANESAESTPSLAASSGALPEGDLSAGSHSLSDFPVGITFDLPHVEPPAVWFTCSPSAVEQAVCLESAPERVIAVTF